jgi:hypothetical protein
MDQPRLSDPELRSRAGDKLGVCVVYIADANFAWMVNLQLNAIETFTRNTDFTLYAALPRAASTVRKLLEARPFVEIVETPPTSARKAAEHAHHMEHLVEHAKLNGCSHIAAFDSDSFPIDASWFGKMSSLLTEQTPLVAVSRTELGDYGLPHPCGMLFTAEFHDRWQPRFLPPRSRRELRYRKRYRLARDTGIGYALALERANLDWIELRMTARPPENIFCAAVYGDMIFHFGGGVRLHVVLNQQERRIHYLYKRMKWFRPLARQYDRFLARRKKICSEERARNERLLREDPERFLSALIDRPVRLDQQE